MSTPRISFEFFPPQTLDASFRLWETVQMLAPLKPSFVSVTYGAGGTTRKLTHEAVGAIGRNYGLNVAAHLTCVDATRAETLEIAEAYAAAGVTEIVALRGDAPKGAEWYVCVECQKGASEAKQPMAVGLQELIDLADPVFDFSDTDFVYFLFPHAAESKFGTSMYFHQTTINTAEGPQQVSVYGERGGSSQPEVNLSPVWAHLIHEMLHFQGWIGHGPYNDTSIMSNDGGASKAVTSWEAFLAGWFGTDEIVCLDAASLRNPVYITMSPLDLMEGKPVSVMVRLSDEELLVIERRSSGKYSNFAAATNYGGQLKDLNHFTAYRVNVNDPYQRVDGRDFAEIGPNFWSYVLDSGQLKIKSSVTYKGLTITVVGSHQIRLSLAS